MIKSSSKCFWNLDNIENDLTKYTNNISYDSIFEINLPNETVNVSIEEYNINIILIEKIKKFFNIDIQYMMRCNINDKKFLIINRLMEKSNYISLEKFDLNIHSEILESLRLNIVFKYLMGYRKEILKDIYIKNYHSKEVEKYTSIFASKNLPLDFEYNIDNVFLDINDDMLKYFDNDRHFILYIYKILERFNIDEYIDFVNNEIKYITDQKILDWFVNNVNLITNIITKKNILVRRCLFKDYLMDNKYFREFYF